MDDEVWSGEIKAKKIFSGFPGIDYLKEANTYLLGSRFCLLKINSSNRNIEYCDI